MFQNTRLLENVFFLCMQPTVCQFSPSRRQLSLRTTASVVHHGGHFSTPLLTMIIIMWVNLQTGLFFTGISCVKKSIILKGQLILFARCNSIQGVCLETINIFNQIIMHFFFKPPSTGRSKTTGPTDKVPHI